MITNSLEKYEVLSILGGTLQSSCYKVKCKNTEEIFVWRAISLDTLNNHALEETTLDYPSNKTSQNSDKVLQRHAIEKFIDNVKQKQNITHPTLVNFFEPIHHEETNTLYVITEFCRYSLVDMINLCKKDEYIDEDFVWYLLYSIVTSVKKFKIYLDIEKIFLGEEFNIKFLYNIPQEHYRENNEIDMEDTEEKIRGGEERIRDGEERIRDGEERIRAGDERQIYRGNKKSKNVVFQIGVILHQLTTLQKLFNKNFIVPKFYSEQLQNVISLLINDLNHDLNVVDAILRHPTVLKSTDYSGPMHLKVPLSRTESKSASLHGKSKIVDSKITSSDCINSDKIDSTSISSKNSNNAPIQENIVNQDIEDTQSARAQNLLNKAAALKNLEEKLKQKEHELHKREKKIALTERIIKEKMTRAELYLKKCKENKTHSKASLHERLKSKNLDTSFSADCGDTSILPTSKKINPCEIMKPPVFTRTFSEKRVKFKGHSPLRTIQYTNTIRFNRHNQVSSKPPVAGGNKMKEYQIETTSQSDKENVTETDSTTSLPNDKRSFSIFRSIRKSKSKKPLFRNSMTSNDDTGYSGEEKGELNCQPIAWPEDAKKHAFELLRMINSAEDVQNNFADVKHTYL